MSPKDIKLVSQGLLCIFLNIFEPFFRVFGWSICDEIVAGKALLFSYRWHVERNSIWATRTQHSEAQWILQEYKFMVA